jgi:putative membrane protein insertion efficiency factor
MPRSATVFGRLMATGLKLPVWLYRYTLSPLIGQRCRHLPTCSEYALDAIDTNGAWRGFWLMVSRLSRCHPWGTSGFDPAPDIRHEHHPWAPWRYGRWRACHLRHPDGMCEGGDAA